MMITVFTPTYNRAHTLQRLYDSLCKQIHRDFEWLIVDDGSTDETCQRIRSFQAKASFPIRYLKKDNGGKHTAYNVAISNAAGEYFFCVDSDDYLTDDALTAIAKNAEDNSDAVGIVGLKVSLSGVLLSDSLPDLKRVSSLAALGELYHCRGEFSIILRTDVAKQLPYPVFAGERFIGECVVYDQLIQYGELALLNQPLTICEYQPDGYSAGTNRLMRENPAGYCLYFMQRIDLVSGLLNRLVTAGKYQCFGILARENRSGYQGKHRLFTSLCYPVGLLFFIYYKICRGF